MVQETPNPKWFSRIRMASLSLTSLLVIFVVFAPPMTDHGRYVVSKKCAPWFIALLYYFLCTRTKTFPLKGVTKKLLFVLMATFPFYIWAVYDPFFDWMYSHLRELLWRFL